MSKFKGKSQLWKLFSSNVGDHWEKTPEERSRRKDCFFSICILFFVSITYILTINRTVQMSILVIWQLFLLFPVSNIFYLFCFWQFYLVVILWTHLVAFVQQYRTSFVLPSLPKFNSISSMKKILRMLWTGRRINDAGCPTPPYSPPNRSPHYLTDFTFFSSILCSDMRDIICQLLWWRGGGERRQAG